MPYIDDNDELEPRLPRRIPPGLAPVETATGRAAKGHPFAATISIRDWAPDAKLEKYMDRLMFNDRRQ